MDDETEHAQQFAQQLQAMKDFFDDEESSLAELFKNARSPRMMNSHDSGIDFERLAARELPDDGRDDEVD